MFKPAEDMNYYRLLNTIHNRHLFEWYLEIGSRDGKSLANVRGNSIAVDPYFRLRDNTIGAKRQALFFQMTSDDFFETNFLENTKSSISFSFLDGMHLFEYLLRDFINTEKHCKPGAVIALHDCCPFTVEMTTRDYETKRGNWTGDVWKLIPILRTYRPDLTIDIVGARPTGLAFVSNLSPDNNTLSENYDSIVREWMDVLFEGETIEEFYQSIEYERARAFIARSKDVFKAALPEGTTVEDPVFITP